MFHVYIKWNELNSLAYYFTFLIVNCAFIILTGYNIKGHYKKKITLRSRWHSSAPFLLHLLIWQVNKDQKIGGRMLFGCLMADDINTWPPPERGSAAGFGLVVTWFLFQNLCRRPPLCCHLPFGPAVKRWHAQRHIGFHYFHSYEGATLDSSQAIMANQESLPRHTRKHTHSPSKCSPWNSALCANENKLILMRSYDPSSFCQ